MCTGSPPVARLAAGPASASRPLADEAASSSPPPLLPVYCGPAGCAPPGCGPSAPNAGISMGPTLNPPDEPGVVRAIRCPPPALPESEPAPAVAASLLRARPVEAVDDESTIGPARRDPLPPGAETTDAPASAPAGSPPLL